MPKQPSLEFVEKEIEITVGNTEGGKFVPTGKETVIALCAGALAVHESRFGGPTQVITHIPTGYRFSYSPSVEKAKKAVKAMLASPVDWERLTLGKCKHKETRKAANQLIRKLDNKGLIFQRLL